MASEYEISASPKEDYEKYYSYLDPFVAMNKVIFIWILMGTIVPAFVPLVPLYLNESYHNCTNLILNEGGERYVHTFLIMLFGYSLLGNINIGRDNMDIKWRKLMNYICFVFNFYVWSKIVSDATIFLALLENRGAGCMIMDYCQLFGFVIHYSTLITCNTIICYHRCVVMFESQKPTGEIP